jgi:hypothetical protein
MSTSTGNIFLTTENLAFSLPLLFVCGSYVSSCFIVGVALYLHMHLLTVSNLPLVLLASGVLQIRASRIWHSNSGRHCGSVSNTSSNENP